MHKFALNHIPKRAFQCYEAGIGLDFNIKVSGKEVKASKFVLAEISPVFEAMFTNDWKDSANSRMDIEDFDYPEVDALVRLIHGLEFISSNVELTIKLMLVADKYEVLELRDQCKEYVMNGLNEENVMDVLIVAHQLGFDDIQQKALDLITSLKMNEDKLFDEEKLFEDRTFRPDLWAMIAKVVYPTTLLDLDDDELLILFQFLRVYDAIKIEHLHSRLRTVTSTLLQQKRQLEIRDCSASSKEHYFPVSSFDSVKFIDRFNPNVLTKLDIRLIECVHGIDNCKKEDCKSAKEKKLIRILNKFKRASGFGPITEFNIHLVDQFVKITRKTSSCQL